MVQINKNLFGAFIILLIVSVLFSIYAFMKKGKSVAPITLVMYNKVFNYESENNYTKEQFWDNYPYWTLLSREQPIDTSIELQNEDGIIVPLSTIINQN
jgi:hypothetical protein